MLAQRLPLGPVVGPLMICGYLVEENSIGEIKALGAKDSKMLTSEKREELAPLLKKLADDYFVIKVSAKEIDKLRDISNLNKIEIARMKELIRMFRPDKVIIDSPEVNTKKFCEKIKHGIKFDFELVAENFADRRYPEVSAASILAKVERDRAITRLHGKYGFFGSGYSHDERTVEFLKEWFKRNKGFPDFVRKSWFTALAIKEAAEQKSMMEFLGE